MCSHEDGCDLIFNVLVSDEYEKNYSKSLLCSIVLLLTVYIKGIKHGKWEKEAV